jgi:hypothetical protein
MSILINLIPVIFIAWALLTAQIKSFRNVIIKAIRTIIYLILAFITEIRTSNTL